MHQAHTGDPHFYEKVGPFSLSFIASAARGTTNSPDITLHGLASLTDATLGDLSFLNHRKHEQALRKTKAGAVLVQKEMLGFVPSSVMPIVVERIDESWSLVCRLFHPLAEAVAGIHSTATIANSAFIHPSAEIGAYACIGERVTIGENSRIGAHTVIAAGVVLGNDCSIGSHVSVTHALLGSRVHLHSGVRIGQEGFGLSSGPKKLSRVPQLGRVIIGDDVEIGANTTVDRGSVQDTIIGAGTYIDNLVQIGHNVQIGRSCIIVAQVGISGSTVLGDYVQVGGQAAMAPHLFIGNRARIGAQAGVIADIPDGAAVIGSPAQPRLQFWRQVALLKQLAARSQSTH